MEQLINKVVVQVPWYFLCRESEHSANSSLAERPRS